MAHSAETRAAVRAAYIFDRLDLPAAAATQGIPLTTARKWKSLDGARGDDWDKARAVSGFSKGGNAVVVEMVLSSYLMMHQKTITDMKEAEDIPPMQRAETMARLADAFAKTMAASAKAAPELGHYAIATELLKMQAVFVRENFPQHAAAFAEILQPFAAYVTEKYDG